MNRSQLMKVEGRYVSTMDHLSKSEIAVLLALGYSNKMIRRSVRCSDNQISLVVKQTGIKRKDYRDGVSPIAKWVAGKAQVTARSYVKPRLLHQ